MVQCIRLFIHLVASVLFQTSLGLFDFALFLVIIHFVVNSFVLLFKNMFWPKNVNLTIFPIVVRCTTGHDTHVIFIVIVILTC